MGTPKTGRGRAIAISPALARLLARHKAEQNQQRLKLGVVYRNLGFVFAKETGEPLQMNNFGQREFAQLIEASGVKKIRFHNLRHTCATLLLARGMHPKIVQERLGHSNISMTLDRYSHVTPTMQREAAQVMGDILNIH
ncbi:MAG: site-specific integrase [Firmicutes bacterium]|nr:site-specific integrase [Bacillota bacterium]